MPPIRRYAKYLLKSREQMVAAYNMLAWLTAYHMARDGVRPAWFDNRWGFTNGYTAVLTNDVRFALGGGRERLDLAALTPSQRAEVAAVCKERADWFQDRVEDEKVIAMILGMFKDEVSEVFCRTEQNLTREAAELKHKKRVLKRAKTKHTRKRKTSEWD
jgi:hypothetical protein